MVFLMNRAIQKEKKEKKEKKKTTKTYNENSIPGCNILFI